MESKKRLIYANELTEGLKSLTGMFTDEIGFAVSLESVLWKVDAQPTVDAVEVVRCKDCKHRGDAEGCPMRYFETDRSYDCDGHMMLDYFDHDYTKDDGFCDRGERREGE